MEESAMSLEVNESTITKDSKVGASEETTEVESKGAAMETSDDSSFASKFMSYAKTCDQCQSMRTSRWRRGPSGPKTLCNTCGVRYLDEKKMKGSRNVKTIQKKNKGPYKALLIRASSP